MPNEFFEKAVLSLNMAKHLSETKLNRIGDRVVRGKEADKQSRHEWEDIADKALELAKLDFKRRKKPWPEAADINYPLISRAAIQFSSNLIGEIIKGDNVVQTRVIGKDPNEQKYLRAARIDKYLNYQLMVENNDWSFVHDRALQYLGVVGLAFVKLYFCPTTNKKKIEFCTHKEVVVDYYIDDLESARRITHCKTVHANTLIEHMRSGVYNKLSKEELKLNSQDPEESMHDILEQHCYLDLDEDGYEEPYIVTVHEETKKVLRIVPRYDLEDISYNNKNEVSHIEPKHYFVDFHCIPSFDGSFYSIGFGTLLYTLNHTVNTGLNQLIDAGTLANTQTGYISKSLAMRSGPTKLTPGHLQKLDGLIDSDIRKGIQFLDFKEPSSVLFQLMAMLDQTAKELSNTGDLMTGNELKHNAKTGAVNSLLERGMKVYSSIQKRVFRSLNKEFKILYNLNRIYLDQAEYSNVLDDPQAILENDFEDQTIDVVTVADPELASDAQRMSQVQFLMETLQMQMPDVDRIEILRRAFQLYKIQDPEKILPLEQQMPTMEERAQAQAEQQSQLEMQFRLEELQIKKNAQQIEIMKLQQKAQESAVKSEQRETALDLKQQQQINEAVAADNKVRAELQKEYIKASVKEKSSNESNQRSDS